MRSTYRLRFTTSAAHTTSIDRRPRPVWQRACQVRRL